MTPPDWFLALSLNSRKELIEFVQSVAPKKYRNRRVVPKRKKQVIGCKQVFGYYLDFIDKNIYGYVLKERKDVLLITVENLPVIRR